MQSARASPRVLHGLLLGFVSCMLAVAIASALEVCDQAHAFAGDPGSSFSLNAPAAAAGGGDALVLMIHDTRLPLDPPVQAAMNVSYTSALTGFNSAISDSEGIIMITEFASQPMHVSVLRNSREPVAFTFMSYIANFPLCFVPLAPDMDFFAKLPARIPPSNDPARFYMSARAPAGANAFTVTITGAGSVYYSAQRNINEQSATIIPGGAGTFPWDPNTQGSVVFFMVIPQQEFSGSLPTVRASIAWEARGAQQPPPPPPLGPGAWAPVVQGPPPSQQQQLLPLPGSPRGPATAAPASAPISPSEIAEDAGVGFGSFLLFSIVTFLIYMVGRSVYNYRVRGITEYPEYVPHHERFAELKKMVVTLKSNVAARRAPLSGIHRGGYEDVSRDELEG